MILLDPRFYEEGKHDFVTLRRIDPDLFKKLPIEKIKKEVIAAQDQFEAYRNAVKSDLYNYMRPFVFPNIVNTTIEEDEILRDHLKTLMFVVLCSGNRFIKQPDAEPKRQFRSLFPEVYKIFCMYKSKGKESLPVLLQKIETELVLDRAAKKFSKSYPSCPLFSVHDALVVESSHSGFCSEILKQ